jgi:hypothetical protein
MLEDRNLLSTFTVDHLADDLVGDGLNGSLRYCISNAADGDDIQFGVTGTINLAGALPDLTRSVSIQGPGANNLTVRRDTGGVYSIFTVASGTTASISGLTVTHGSVPFNDVGGGIANFGTLTVTDCTVTSNFTSYTPGGGIFNAGLLTVTDSTVSGNYPSGIVNRGTLTVTGSTLSGNVSGYGGGIVNTGTGTVTNSTISGNYAGGHDNPGGGGIANFGTLTVTDSTISDNRALMASGGGILQSGGTISLRDTIIAGNQAIPGYGPDVYGLVNSEGYNLIGNTQGGSGFDPSDLLNVNAMLGPLQDNGGPTQTMALLAGSPALNAGDPAQLGVADQRGVARSGGVNIGAYQASASAFVLTAPATVSAGVAFDGTVQAVDPFAQTAVGYTGTVTFTSTDTGEGVVVPADYSFTAADSGSHTFPGGVTLVTAGDWTVTATDPDNMITGSVPLTVVPG